jgi:Putative transposase/Transposase zinc-binding domain
MVPDSASSAATAAENNPSFEVADIFRAHGPAYRDAHPLSIEVVHAMRDIERCRTAALGGHVDVCEKECGYVKVSYNSCRNRHCPKCQGLHALKWLELRLERLLPTHYFHLVVTLPHEFNTLVLYKRKLLLDMLFKAASRALLDYALGWERFGAQIGFTSVLHTWNQDLSFHPHLHIIATGGGLDPSATRWISSRLNFLVPVRGLSVRVRELFCTALEEAFTNGKLSFPQSMEHLNRPEAFRRFLRKRRRQKWVVYCKQPFGGPEQFLGYIGRYTHRVAISNKRLLGFSNGRVTFKARDNHNPGQHRIVVFPADEFIRRFLLHVLPTGFVKIRHYGLMAPRNATTKLQIARELIVQCAPSTPNSTGQPLDKSLNPVPTWRERLHQLTGTAVNICPRCGAHTVRKPLSAINDLCLPDERVAMNST